MYIRIYLLYMRILLTPLTQVKSLRLQNVKCALLLLARVESKYCETISLKTIFSICKIDYKLDTEGFSSFKYLIVKNFKFSMLFYVTYYFYLFIIFYQTVKPFLLITYHPHESLISKV